VSNDQRASTERLLLGTVFQFDQPHSRFVESDYIDRGFLAAVSDDYDLEVVRF
jgi:hypothetical protein